MASKVLKVLKVYGFFYECLCSNVPFILIDFYELQKLRCRSFKLLIQKQRCRSLFANISELI